MGSVLPCCLPYGKAGGLQILCCQGIKVADYNFTLDALALKPSDFCNLRVDNARRPLEVKFETLILGFIISEYP